MSRRDWDADIGCVCGLLTMLLGLGAMALVAWVILLVLRWLGAL